MKKNIVKLFGFLFLFFYFQIAMAINIDSLITHTIFSEINQYRLQQHLPKLTLNPLISKVAEEHSREMALHQIPFGHDGFQIRMHDLLSQIPANAMAENVVYVYTNADEMVKLWLNSSEHRENIVGNYNLTGIGIAHDRDGRIYATQIFLHV